ncbi:DUF1799 domain-containing protein [Variovorax sp. HJSM1_2]|uniref:DUF1799 domain-containing protein n=1 Tax=Variovorax sp. HJSM1_2 TaxID=3366263 RepID=UPI003BEE01CC
MGRCERRTRKKLVGAALRWAGLDEPDRPESPVDQNVLDGARAMGATPEQLEQLKRQLAPPADTSAYQVWPENWDSLEFFVSVASQWVTTENRYTGDRRFDRLDYAGVEAAARMLRLPKAKLAAMFTDLQGMEQALRSASAKAFKPEPPPRGFTF